MHIGLREQLLFDDVRRVMRIAVLGAGGVAGRALLPRLLARGHALRGSFFGGDGASIAAHAGVEATRCDVLDPASVTAFIAGCDAVINLATSVPRAGGRGDWAANDRVRRAGTKVVVEACARVRIAPKGAPTAIRLVQQSVAMLHCADDRRAQNEDDPVEGYGALASAVELESIVAQSAIDWRIARGALFHGPGTGRDEAWRTQVTDAAFRVPGDGGAWHCFIHVEDFADALCVLVEHPAPRQAYIVCDDRPLTLAQLYGELARLHGHAAPPAGGAPAIRSFRVTNAKLRALGWAPRHRALFEGA